MKVHYICLPMVLTIYAVYAAEDKPLDIYDTFSKQLYAWQEGLLNKKHYTLFIQKHSAYARNNLDAPNYLAHHYVPYQAEPIRYIDRLLAYTVACYRSFLRPTLVHQGIVQRTENDLRLFLMQLNASINIDAEIKKTTSMLHKAQYDYHYNYLSYYSRLYLWAMYS